MIKGLAIIRSSDKALLYRNKNNVNNLFIIIDWCELGFESYGYYKTKTWRKSDT